MKILMMTNTYDPVVGGVEHSIRALSSYFIKQGHEILIVAPSFKDMQKHENNVIRIPAIQNFNHSDFSVNLPVPGLLQELMRNFKPDIVHSHHPFLIGDIALRLCGQYNVPLVFTYHTMYEEYLHYLPFHNNAIKRFIIELSAGYANLCDHVIVPSQSVKNILAERDVQAPTDIIPTGIDLQLFGKGDGRKIKKRLNIPEDAFVLGHVGRLAREKNLEFLSSGICELLKKETRAHFLIVGKGPVENIIRKMFSEAEVLKRVHFAGALSSQELVDSYHAMDVFVFTSKSETQGVVLAESMAAGIPVVALDSPGVREIIKDQINGRLINPQGPEQKDKEEFISALNWCMQRTDSLFREMKLQAVESAKVFSGELCAEKVLEIYRHVTSSEMTSKETDNSFWHVTMQRLKAEWSMAKNFVDATESAYVETSFEDKARKKIYLKDWIIRIRRWLNRHEWSARFLNLSKSEGSESQRGLIIIQIDGFSKTQLQKAIKNKKMPFLKELTHKERYKVYPLYAGLPSSTPSVQGELFYGVKQVIPAFSYFDSIKKKVFTMFDGDDVLAVEKRLQEHGGELLNGGSSYSNVFEGGAGESHFCAGSLGWARIWRDIGPLNIILLAVTHFLTFLKIIILILAELILGLIAFISGLIKGENLRKEFKFVLTRATICVLLRELITIGAKIDIARGLPIVHLNYLGYDEQAHRRGPSSGFAHRALKGIDFSIASIYKAALCSSRRNYDVWIYSDHGQEDVVSYINKYGCRVHEAIEKVYRELNMSGNIQARRCEQHKVYTNHHSWNGIQFQRVRYLGNKLSRNYSVDDADAYQKEIVVTAIGPTGNIYIKNELDDEKKSLFAYRLVHSAGIPTVLSVEESGKVRAWNKNGVFLLPEQAKDVIGEGHPYIREVTQDLIDVCHHPDAGTFTVLGWCPGSKPMSFPVESGAHAGPGTEETNAFALLPSDVVSLPEKRPYLRTSDLREYALKYSGRQSRKEEIKYSVSEPEKITAEKTIRIMTYNVHSCVGMDGKTSPERIARVIGRHEPDIVALQELDKRRPRTGNIDQPHIIAKELEMICHFHPSISIEEEHYGNAIMSRYPIELIYAGQLPTLNNKPNLESRGAIWVNINVGNASIQIVNTHLGLDRKERLKQAQALMSEDWLGKTSCEDPAILCGDFNALPGSPAFKHITQKYSDAQYELDNHRPHPTWFSHYPIGRIDHVFTSPKIEVVNVEVSKTKLDKISSDHLPLIVDVRIKY